MTTKPQPREARQPMKLECRCGCARRVWVSPDASTKLVAKAHGWGLREGYWECPECREAQK